ncbi:MAG TPA: hydrogenase expression/formation protein HypE [Armatimonadetes bacterium]|nr:hydrogenase expression/formation protein HypE [Armatimonadota bacterium]
MEKVITLGHGSGGALTQELIERFFVPAFDNEPLRALTDSALIAAEGKRLAFTTDSYVVKPWQFPGGDIGKLAVTGTVNDLAVVGARPIFLSVGFILEEGFPLSDLHTVINSLAETAQAAGVQIVTGDTKVVERGSGDGIYLNTAGLGVVPKGVNLSAQRVAPGDVVLVSGPLGEHEICVLLARGELEFEAEVLSDCAPVQGLVQMLLENIGEGVKWLRDPTRGGLATALNELARACGYDLLVEEAAVPVQEPVRVLCDLLGYDPLYLANEGKIVAVLAPQVAEEALAVVREHELGREAALIGRVLPETRGRVLLQTGVGGRRIVDLLAGAQWPRIC